jgi:hypothetical protein
MLHCTTNAFCLHLNKKNFKKWLTAGMSYKLLLVMRVLLKMCGLCTVYFLILNPFQSRVAIWHYNFNSVLHMLYFWDLQKFKSFKPKEIVAFLGWKVLTLSSSQNCNI